MRRCVVLFVALTALCPMQDLCRTDPRGVQLLQALGAVQNPTLAAPSFQALHSVPPPALAPAVSIPRVLSSPSLPPLSVTATPRQAARQADVGGAWQMSSPPTASAAAPPASNAGASQPRKRRKRGRASGGASPRSGASPVADAPASSRGGKRSRPSPLGSPAAAAPSIDAVQALHAAPPVDSSGVARDLMALLAQQVPRSAGLAGCIAAQHGLVLGDSGASGAALAAPPMPAGVGGTATAAVSGCAPVHLRAPQDRGMHVVHPPGPIVPQESALGGVRDGEHMHAYASRAPSGISAVNDSVAGVSLGLAPPAAAAAAATDGGAPLSPQQRTDLAHRLEAVFGGMGMDSATIAAGLALVLGVHAGQPPGW